MPVIDSAGPATAGELFSCHRVASGNDPEQAREVLSETYLPLRLEPAGARSALDLRLNVVQLGRVTAGYLHFGDAVSIRTVETRDYHVDIPLRGRAVTRSGQHDPVYCTAHTAAVFMPDLPAVLDWDPGCAQVCLMLPREEIHLELQNLLGRPITGTPDFHNALDLRTPAGQGLLAKVQVIDAQTRGPGGLLDYPLAAARLERELLGSFLRAALHNFTSGLNERSASIGQGAVGRAMELLRFTPERPWSVTQLAAELSVSVRALQSGFQKSHGISPMAYLRQLRLERVHHDLVAADPATVTVTAIAGRWGFTHLGRFAHSYQVRFRELPSETLRLRNGFHQPVVTGRSQRR